MDVLDDAEVVPDAVDRGVEFAAAREVGVRAIEFANREISVPAPSQEQRVVWIDRESLRERLDGFAKLPRAGLRNAEIDGARDVLRIFRERGARSLDCVGVRL